MAGISGAAGTHARLLYSPAARRRQRRPRPRQPLPPSRLPSIL